jgi:pyruvate dehydrogenase E1 component alpha subunit
LADFRTIRNKLEENAKLPPLNLDPSKQAMPDALNTESFAVTAFPGKVSGKAMNNTTPENSHSPERIAPTDNGPRAFEKAPVNAALTPKDKIELLRTMYRIRRFEERSIRAYQQGQIGGFLHLYIGEESVAVGSISVRGPDDHVITAYRDHGHALAVGMTENECMAELFGKAAGCSHGKGGSMHLFAPDKNYWGGHGIVGGQTPLGLGLAYAVKYKGLKGAALSYMGDGAVNQGVFHESLNLAGLWNLPVVYIIENNGYSMGTSEARSSAFSGCLAKRSAEGYGIDWDIANGHHLYEVRAKVAEALERAHEKSRPTVLELVTYRYRGHSIADANAEKYRSKEEITEYQRTKDPLHLFETVLIEDGVLNTVTLAEIDEAAKKEAADAADFALKAPWPTEETITQDVYWTTDHPGEHDNEGRIIFNDDWPTNKS